MTSKLFLPGDIILIRAKPNSSKSALVWDGTKEQFNVFLHCIAEDGKANEELVKLFKKVLKLRVELITGFKSKTKKVKVL